MKVILFGLLTILVIGTSYTDWKYRKIYNKFLLVCLMISLTFHAIDGTFIDSIFTMTMAFFSFFLYMYLA